MRDRTALGVRKVAAIAADDLSRFARAATATSAIVRPTICRRAGFPLYSPDLYVAVKRRAGGISMPVTCSQSLVDSLQRATGQAERQNRKYATSEDLLIALTDDPDAADIIGALLVDTGRLRRDLEAYMQSAADEADDAVAPSPDGPRLTPELRQVLEWTFAAVHTSGRDVATGADVLIELFTQPAGHFLLQQGATRYDATRYASHGIRKGDPAPPAASSGSGLLARVRILNDSYTPMEFVVHVLEHIFDMEHEGAIRLMLEIHHTGAAVCGTYPYDVAQAKVTELLAFARRHQHPLQCVLEPGASA
jgi:ATP-dependent Clp protease adapter protein ClpS